MSEAHDEDDLDEDDLDEDADDEEGEDEEQDESEEQPPEAPQPRVHTSAREVREAQRARAAKAKETSAAQAPPRRSPFDKPEGAEWGAFLRHRDGVTERLRIYNDAEERWVDAFPVSVPIAEVLHYWGGGRYTARWYANGRIVSSGPTVEIGAGIAAKPKDARLESEHAQSAPQPHHAPRPVWQTTTGAIAGAVPPPSPASPPPAPAQPALPQQAPTGISEYLAWQNYFEERESRRSEYRIQLERDAHARAQADADARHRRDLDEADARNRRAMEHQAALTKQLLEASRSAMDVSDLDDRLAALEKDKPEPVAPSELAELVTSLTPVLSELLANRQKLKGPTT